MWSTEKNGGRIETEQTETGCAFSSYAGHLNLHDGGLYACFCKSACFVLLPVPPALRSYLLKVFISGNRNVKYKKALVKWLKDSLDQTQND